MTEALRTAALAMDLELVLDPGGGAFYGPKISVQARDAIGRTWQISTIQVDFQLPQRFEMEYVGEDNARHRPIMIHRALFGSIERFFAILLEHYAGAFPTWLSPVQVRILPVRDDHGPYADEVRARLSDCRRSACRGGGRREPLGARIRRAKMDKLPYVLVVGDADVEAGTVGVNARGSDAPERGVTVDSFVEKMRVEAAPPARRRSGPRASVPREPRPPLGRLAFELCELLRRRGASVGPDRVTRRTPWMRGRLHLLRDHAIHRARRRSITCSGPASSRGRSSTPTPMPRVM